MGIVSNQLVMDLRLNAVIIPKRACHALSRGVYILMCTYSARAKRLYIQLDGLDVL